jgi:glycosyltransferase involved in cell wall biosynthesis
MKGTETMTESPPEISIVVPCYNERENLRPLLAEVHAALDPLGKPWEMVITDDASKDGSWDEMRAISREDPRLRVQRNRKNSGETAASWAGMVSARGRVVVTMDADLQNDPKDIPLLLKELERFDVAVGWRARRQDSIVKRITSRVGNRARNWLTHEDIADTGCSLKAFKRDAVCRLRLFKGMHRFLPTLCKLDGFTVVQVKVNHRPRVMGKTKYGVLDRLWQTVPDVLAVRWMRSRIIRYKVREEGRS